MNTNNTMIKPCSKKKNSTSTCSDTLFLPSCKDNATASDATCCAKKSTAVKASACTGTTIRAKIDIGWGNQLFIRGEGANLSWDEGQPMENAGENEWVWKTKKATSDLTFKLLINDQQWSAGDNYSAASGSNATIEPSF